MQATLKAAVEDKFLDLLRPYLKFVAADEAVGADRPLEDVYGVVIPDRLLVPESFRSAQSLWDVVQSLRGTP